MLVHALRDLSKRLSASEAAEIAALERKYFSKLFLRETGFRFTWWNREIRMRRAEELLTGGRLTIGFIAGAVGYGNLTTFERSFKARSGGVGPSAYLASSHADASQLAQRPE